MPPGNGIIKPVALTAPKPKAPVAIAPQNAGLPIGLPNVTTAVQPGNPILAAPPAPPAPAAPAAPAPPPVDFWGLARNDPGYINSQANIDTAHNLAAGNPATGDIGTLLRAFKGTAQGYQDNANAHGALFSGAAVHANNYAAQGYADQAAQEALGYKSASDNNLTAAWQRILNLYTPGAS